MTPIRIYGEIPKIKKIFFWFIWAILFSQIISIFIVLTTNDTKTVLLIIITVPFVLGSTYFVRHEKFEEAATILSVVLLSLVTLVATLGLGIHHLSVLGYPVILIVASLVTRRRVMVFLTLFSIGCVAWLVFGELSGVYTPEGFERSVPGDFFTATLIILMTAFFVRLLSETLFKNNIGLQKELAERKMTEEKLEQDIALRLDAEEKIRQLNEDLEARVRDRTAQLEAINQELEAFSYSVSHDLRAPLRGITGYAQLLQDKITDKLTPEEAHYLKNVLQSAQHMGVLIDGMLKLGRITRSDLAKTTLSLSKMAQEIIDSLRLQDESRQVMVTIQPGVTAQGDPHLMRIVLENLLGNAWKFTSQEPQAQIEFETSQQDGKPLFIVRDNGVGFNMEYANRLFNAFQRLHGMDEFEGTGIGLASVRRIIHRHGGEVWVKAEEGKGATFFFTLSD